jgi:hypothetical protein
MRWKLSGSEESVILKNSPTANKGHLCQNRVGSTLVDTVTCRSCLRGRRMSKGDRYFIDPN